MPTRQRRAFRPAVSGLEDRTVFSRGFATTPPVLAAAPPVVATAPAPGNDGQTLAAWTGMHREYAARARRGGDAVVFLGDSLVYLWGDPRRRDRPDQLGPLGLASWNAVIAPDRAANFGIVGDQTGNLLWRVQHGELAGRPRVAVVLVGLNNLLRGQTPEETAAGIAAVVGAVRAASPTTQVLLLGLPPARPSPDDPLRVGADRVNALVAGLAGDHVTYRDVGDAFLRPDGTLTPGLVQAASVHPTEDGYRVLSEAVRTALEPLLGVRARVLPGGPRLR